MHQYQNPKDVDVKFWQCMCKRGGTDPQGFMTSGGGPVRWLNGWFNVFLPFLKDDRSNRYCEPYSEKKGYVQEELKENIYQDDEPAGVWGEAIKDLPTGVVSGVYGEYTLTSGLTLTITTTRP